jgi:hypothetical protein
VKRAALYLRVSTLDQHPETQLYDLRQMASQRGWQIVEEYTDRVSGAKARRPGLDQEFAESATVRAPNEILSSFKALISPTEPHSPGCRRPRTLLTHH